MTNLICITKPRCRLTIIIPSIFALNNNNFQCLLIHWKWHLLSIVPQPIIVKTTNFRRPIELWPIFRSQISTYHCWVLGGVWYSCSRTWSHLYCIYVRVGSETHHGVTVTVVGLMWRLPRVTLRNSGFLNCTIDTNSSKILFKSATWLSIFQCVKYTLVRTVASVIYVYTLFKSFNDDLSVRKWALRGSSFFCAVPLKLYRVLIGFSCTFIRTFHTPRVPRIIIGKLWKYALRYGQIPFKIFYADFFLCYFQIF